MKEMKKGLIDHNDGKDSDGDDDSLIDKKRYRNLSESSLKQASEKEKQA